MRQTPVARRPARRRIDYDACCLLLAAVVRQARKDARSNDPDAIIFLNAINAPETVTVQRQRRIAPYRTGGERKRRQRNARQ